VLVLAVHRKEAYKASVHWTEADKAAVVAVRVGSLQGYRMQLFVVELGWVGKIVVVLV